MTGRNPVCEHEIPSSEHCASVVFHFYLFAYLFSLFLLWSLFVWYFRRTKKKCKIKKWIKNLKSSWIMWIVVLKVQFVRHEQQTLWYRIRTLMLPRVMSAAESRDFKDFLVISGYPNIITIFPCHLMSHSLY